jgi:hypothetical protein
LVFLSSVGKKVIDCYTWIIAFCGSESWALWKVDQKYMKSFEMWCWRRMEDISWTYSVKNKYHKESRRKGDSYV